MDAREVMALIKSNDQRYYVYVLQKPSGAPFYIGIGSGRRLLDHEADARRTRLSSHKLSIIRKLRRFGLDVRYEIAGFFDEWGSAARIERNLIAIIGRHDLARGPLANRTDGGEGAVGLIMSASAREKCRAGRLGKKQSRAARIRIGDFHRGKVMSPESRAKMSASRKGLTPARSTIEASVRAHRGRPLSDDHKRKLREAKIGRVLPASHKDKISSRLRGRKFSETHRLALKGANLTATPVEVFGREYSSIHEAITSLQISRAALYRWLYSGKNGARRVGMSKLAARTQI
jgi:hypothetical protein